MNLFKIILTAVNEPSFTVYPVSCRETNKVFVISFKDRDGEIISRNIPKPDLFKVIKKGWLYVVYCEEKDIHETKEKLKHQMETDVQKEIDFLTFKLLKIQILKP